MRSSIRDHPYVWLLLLILGVRIATALPLQQAGYMDASYAMHVAERLAQGHGFTEEILWNYLDRPSGLPHPSNLYWMPLPSILVAPFFFLFGDSYRVAQIPFILLSSLLPLFAFYFSRRVFMRDDYAWAAALFTAFSGFYTVYWVSPDNFAPFAITASLTLFFIARGTETNSARYWVVAGGLAALSHLSRADGVLLLAVPPLTLFLRSSTRSLRTIIVSLTLVLAGYLLLMSPWFIRNYLAVGTPYPSAGTKTLWLTNYDEVFHFTDDLTLSRYLAWGIGSIIGSKIYAAAIDLLVVCFGALQVFLVPFVVVGLWQLRRRVEFLPFLVYAVLLYLAMAFAFTFPSWRGTMLHSAAALLPFFAVAAPAGIDETVRWVARRRRAWDVSQATVVFRWGFVGLAAVISLFVYSQGIFGAIVGQAGDTPLWNQQDAELVNVAAWLDKNAGPNDVVMDVDPPSFFNISHRRAIMVPTDGPEAVVQAARQFGARYMLLRYYHPKPLNDLYMERATIPGLECKVVFQDPSGHPTYVFEIKQ